MNILFFLTPKEEVAHVDEDDTLRQVVEKVEHQRVFCDTIISERWKIYRNDHRMRACSGRCREKDFPDLAPVEKIR